MTAEAPGIAVSEGELKLRTSIDVNRLQYLRDEKQQAVDEMATSVAEMMRLKARRADIENIMSAMKPDEEADIDASLLRKEHAEIDLRVSEIASERQSHREFIETTSHLIMQCERYLEKLND